MQLTSVGTALHTWDEPVQNDQSQGY